MNINLCYGCMTPREGPGPCPVCGFDESRYEPALHHLPPGTVLYGKYLIGRVLGEGGFGITYIGWDLNLEMKIAVKEYYPNGLVTRNCAYDRTVTMLTGQKTAFFQSGLEKFVDEARRLGKFWRLPGIVAVKDYFQENKTGYIVMEFARGQTLKDILKKQPDSRLPADQVFEMMRPVIKSMETVHKAGLIHRDISPDNLMVDDADDGSIEVKLIDFGAARDYMAKGEKSLSVMLKPGYAPEEQYRSRGQQGPWTDVYGLCATIYRAITGAVPEESLDRVAQDLLRRPSQLGISISHPKEDALMKGLAVFQKDRFTSMEALEAALYESKAPEEVLSGEDGHEEKTEDTAIHDVAARDEAACDDTACAAEPHDAAVHDKVSHIHDNDTEPLGGKKDEDNSRNPESERTVKKSRGAKKTGWIAAAGAAVIVLVFIIYGFTGDSGRTSKNSAAGEKGETKSVVALAGETDADSDSDTLTESIHDSRESRMETEQTETSENEESVVHEETKTKETEKPRETKVTVVREAVAFTDDQMELLIRKGLDRAQGDIYTDELAEIEVLRIDGDAVDIQNSVSKDCGVIIPEPLEGSVINSLDDLEYFTNLKVLEISGHGISDIHILSQMTSLTSLELEWNNISDISDLSGLISLTHLSVRMNNVSDVSPLAGLTALEYLDFYGNNVSDISCLSGLTAMKEFYSGANHVTDLSVLDNYPRLEHYYNGN